MCYNQADEDIKKEQDYESTILLYKRFLEKMPTNGLALYHLGYAYGQTGNHMKEVFYKNPSLNTPPLRAEFFI
jgi:tetratricopeptide (TPR) repeat protein